jgi:hypothetical protein
MKVSKLALIISSIIISTPAFASREECGPQRPNVQIFGSPAPARLTVGSAFPSAVPTHLTFFRPARTRPVLSNGVNQDIDIEIRWANGLVISTFDYNTWDPIWNTYLRTQASRIKNTLSTPIQSINHLRIGSITETNAFNDKVQFQEVFSINSVQWLQ